MMVKYCAQTKSHEDRRYNVKGQLMTEPGQTVLIILEFPSVWANVSKSLMPRDVGQYSQHSDFTEETGSVFQNVGKGKKGVGEKREESKGEGAEDGSRGVYKKWLECVQDLTQCTKRSHSYRVVNSLLSSKYILIIYKIKYKTCYFKDFILKPPKRQVTKNHLKAQTERCMKETTRNRKHFEIRETKKWKV